MVEKTDREGACRCHRHSFADAWLDHVSCLEESSEDNSPGLLELYEEARLDLAIDEAKQSIAEGRVYSLEQVEAMQRNLTQNAARMLPAIDQLLTYVHQRTVQRLTIEAIRTASATGTGVGGVKLGRPVT